MSLFVDPNGTGDSTVDLYTISGNDGNLNAGAPVTSTIVTNIGNVVATQLTYPSVTTGVATANRLFTLVTTSSGLNWGDPILITPLNGGNDPYGFGGNLTGNGVSYVDTSVTPNVIHVLYDTSQCLGVGITVFDTGGNPIGEPNSVILYHELSHWNRRELTRETFGNTIADDPEDANTYLRTGDLGFFYEDELFVCGRIKDLIIIHGVNHHPQDIETIAESSSSRIRSGGVAAFIGDQERENLVVVAEVKTARHLPDPVEIARAIRKQSYVEPFAIVFAAPGTIARTTSGKIARGLTRLRWLSGDLPVIATHVCIQRREALDTAGPKARFRQILEPYHLTGSEDCTFADVGIDSLTLVMLLQEIERLLKDHGVSELTDQVDVWLIQRLTVVEFFWLLDQFETAPADGCAALRPLLDRLKQDGESQESSSMRADTQLKTFDRIQFCDSGEPWLTCS